ncbi:MAG TPA: glycosyltransferase [Desulfobacterales bacterium]|nr:glycosyltransferase [Desulfobacterales bacterium]
MGCKLDQYAEVAGREVIDHLRQLAEPMKGINVVHVNSTREGGGVAEILHRIIPLQQELGINAKWEVITGDPEFYQCTKKMHNALQGDRLYIPETLLKQYEATNRRNYERLQSVLEAADMVYIHDPQPAPLLSLCSNRKGKWIWRCHIDASRPYRPVWKYLRRFVEGYDASIWSLTDFAQPMPHPLYIIPPSIDPLSEKNMELGKKEIEKIYEQYELDPQRPILVQISRFDRFKDPVGVIQAYRMAKAFVPRLQLVLAGGGATDDPEGKDVLIEVMDYSDDDPDIHVLLLPPDAHRTVNALQRISDIALQKSLKEGFGLTVTEAMWKAKPVIGGNAGGIRLQVINHHTGFLVDTPEGAALRIRYLLKNRENLEVMGRRAKEYVRENFLLTRHLREYLTQMVAVMRGSLERIQL